LSGWRWVFILQAVPAIIIGVVTLVYLPNRPSKARFLTMEESSWLEGEISAEYTDIGHVGIKAQLRAIKNPRVLYLSVALFFAAVGFYGFTFFFPQIIKQLNSAYSATNIGFLGAIPFLVGGVGMVLIGRNSDRTMERRYHAVALSGLAAVGLLGTIAFRHNPVLAIISLCMVAVGVLSFIAPFWAMASEGLSKGQTAVGLPMINTIAALGGFFGPYVVGKNATTGNVTLGLYFPIAALIICGVMLLFWKVNRLYATNLGRGPRIREAP